MTPNESRGFRLTVLNPGGHDREQSFPHDAGEPGPEHAPVNFHAFAACTRGSFQRETKRAASGENAGAAFVARRFSRLAARVVGVEKTSASGGDFAEGNRTASNRTTTPRPGEVAAIQINCCNGRRLSRHNAGSGGNFSFLSRRRRGEAGDLYPDGISRWRYAMGFLARARGSFRDFCRHPRI